MKGSFTVELSFVFPIVFIILVILMQYGLYFYYRIDTLNIMNQGLLVCQQARNEGLSQNEASERGKAYLESELKKRPIQIHSLQWEQADDWLREEYTVKITASYSFLVSMSWSAVQKLTWMNTVEFRNRLDFIWEKGQQYLERWEAAE